MTSIARRQEHDSGDYSDASPQENDQDTSGNGGVENESDYDSAASDSERSDRDPENQETERRVDDDEDRSNPQYIPKRGTFYEHDDRTADNGEDSSNTISETASEKKEGGETPSERRRGGRKSESINKWSHDKYNENEQMPKSRDELVAIYGYDIRNEDAPPHARRNRRYGRGPNKYTRTWEDEEAYKRQQAAPPPRKLPNPDEFPELDASNRNNKKRLPRPRSKSQPSSTESVETGPELRRNASTKGRPRPRQARPQTRKDKEKDKMPNLENLTITAAVFNNNQGQPQRKVNATVAQQRPVPTELAKKKPPPPAQPPQQQNNTVPAKPSPPQQKPQPQQQQLQQQQQQQSQPAQQQQQQQQPAEARGSKRYSSLRQRPLDTYSPPQQNQQQNQQPRYHPTQEYPTNPPPTSQHQGSPAPQMQHPQQLMQQMVRSGGVSNAGHGLPSHSPHTAHPPQHPQQHPPQHPPQQLTQQINQQQQQVRLGILEQQQMVSHPHHTMHNIQQHTIGQLQATPQGYAPPAMMPAQYMQQGGSGAVFGGGALYGQPPPAPYAHQMYPPAPAPHHNYAGGVTYYSCAEQEGPPRPARRPTAAIPIVRPQPPDRPANSSEKDNIDRIVENMFVRKPWPATHGADAKEKSETRSSQEPQSKESSQPNSLTSSSISTDSKPSESIEQAQPPQEKKEEQKEQKTEENVEREQESIATDA